MSKTVSLESNKQIDLIRKVYEDPETGFTGLKSLYQKVKEKDPSIKLKTVSEWYKAQTRIRRNDPSSGIKIDQFKIASLNPDSWQLDLTFKPSKQGQINILTAVNINSRFGYAVIIKDKTADTVAEALKTFLDKEKVRIVTTDNGSEFLNNKVRKLFRDRDIRFYNNKPDDHNTMGKIERFNRTLKKRITRSRRALTPEILTKLVKNYNNTIHSAINAKPVDMQGQVIESESKHNQKVLQDAIINFNIGDSVMYRIKKKKNFGKEVDAWSKAIYSIVGMDGYRLQLRSKNGHTLYKALQDVKKVNEEPSNVDADDIEIVSDNIWEVEKILQHKRTRNGKYRYLIKWVNFEEPTWEPQDHLRLVNKNIMSETERKYFNSLKK
jgi:hypothetical protein